MNKRNSSAGTKDEQRTTADDSTSASLVQNGLLSADAVTKISNTALRDFYKLHSLIGRIDANYMQDNNNPMRADNHTKIIAEAQQICQKWINSQPSKAW